MKTYNKATATVKTDVYTMITNLIIEKLDAGVNPWKKTWTGTGVKGEMNGPRNFVTNKVYSGINYLILGCSPFSSPYFMTFKQIQDKGGFLAKGSKSLPVVFFQPIEKNTINEATGKEEVKKNFILKYYNVFNIEQTNLVAPAVVKEEETEEVSLNVEKLDAVYNNFKNAPKLNTVVGSDRCFYMPAYDSVTMPSIAQFDNVESYYSTLYHELIHSTGHSSRLDRDFDGASFGNDKYAKEELIAELGASFICNQVGILNTTVDNSAAYLKGWSSKLKGESTKFIFQASAAAKKASIHILGDILETVELEEA